MISFFVLGIVVFMFEKFRLFKAEPLEIRLDELPLFLLGKFERERKDIESRLASRVKEISDNFSAIRDSAYALKSKSSSNTYANIIKNRFCDKVIKSSGISCPASGYDEMREFISESAEIIRGVSGISMKELRHLHAFQEDMAKIAARIRLIEENVNYANKLIKDSTISKINGIKSDVERIKSSMQKIGELKKMSEDLEKRSVEIGNIIANHRIAFESTNAKLSEYAAKRIGTRELEKKMEDIRQKIDNEFSGLDRTLKKFLYFGEMPKSEAANVKAYIKNPAEAFLEADEQNMIRQVLEDINNYRDKSVIDLDERRHEKVKELLRRFDFLVELRVYYKDLSKKREDEEKELDKQLQPLLAEIKEINANIDLKEKEIGVIKSRLASNSAKIRMLEKEIADTKNKIEMSASLLLDKDIRLV